MKRLNGKRETMYYVYILQRENAFVFPNEPMEQNSNKIIKRKTKY